MWRFLWRYCFPALMIFVIGRASGLRTHAAENPKVIWKDCQEESVFLAAVKEQEK